MAAMDCEYYRAGAVAGHAAGKGRVGEYVVGEAYVVAVAAADAEPIAGWRWERYRDGFEYGYKVGAGGEALETAAPECEEPEPLKLGERVVVHGYKGRVIRVHRAGTIDVECENGACYRVTGLW